MSGFSSPIYLYLSKKDFIFRLDHPLGSLISFNLGTTVVSWAQGRQTKVVVSPKRQENVSGAYRCKIGKPFSVVIHLLCVNEKFSYTDPSTRVVKTSVRRKILQQWTTEDRYTLKPFTPQFDPKDFDVPSYPDNDFPSSSIYLLPSVNHRLRHYCLLL